MKILKLIKSILKDILPSGEFMQCIFGVGIIMATMVLIYYLIGDYAFTILTNIIAGIVIFFIVLGSITSLYSYINDKWNNLD